MCRIIGKIHFISALIYFRKTSSHGGSFWLKRLWEKIVILSYECLTSTLKNWSKNRQMASITGLNVKKESSPRSSFPRSSFPRSSFPRLSFSRSSFSRSSFPRSSFCRSSFSGSSFPRSSFSSLSFSRSSFSRSSFSRSSFF